MKILLTGGGTAGHVTPALAIAETFRRNAPGTEMLFVGTPAGMERRLAEEAGLPYYPIRVMGLRRSITPRNLYALYLAVRSPYAAKRLLREVRPDLVIGTGGYVSWPTLSAAASLGIPTALHESNALPGLTVRRLAGRVDLLLLNFAEAKERLSQVKKVIHVGNPLRGSFSALSRTEARERLGIPRAANVLLSFGGSLGADALNRAVLDLWEDFGIQNDSLFHVHGTGRRYFDAFREEVKGRFGELPPRLHYREYLNDMGALMAAADLIVCRAGAMTLSEIARMRRASILIPSPHVAENHQERNAEALAALGAAELIPERSLTRTSFVTAVRRILEDGNLRTSMESAVGQFDRPNANKRIYEALCCLIKQT
ncbi:MAG: UDP-N-acetylglucosamine--N-acetylmuramyl-(pentapeptide) pyrophosphoryl-undecaprenol N-acetylglucosamine transferase [Clostridia bacterium]|nr:UDP-N-acetylglucosamine--N-acetylmuramyl-(pentapeptide) pyrophosphoryl-undecaprenol N-acetylglucosamine transferase [Clostridia bacterium]